MQECKYSVYVNGDTGSFRLARIHTSVCRRKVGHKFGVINGFIYFRMLKCQKYVLVTSVAGRNMGGIINVNKYVEIIHLNNVLEIIRDKIIDFE